MIREIGAAVRGVLDEGEPVLIFLAGPNGAGKSTFYRDYLQPLGLPFINADEIAHKLRELLPSTETRDLERRAFQMAEERRSLLLDERLSFCTETVFSDPQGAKLEFLRKARTLGYRSFLVFIGLSQPELSVARVMQRVATGGHDVPDEKLRDRYPRTLENVREAIPIVDEAFLFDNSSDLDPFRIVLIYLDGKVVRRVEPLPAWTSGLPGLSGGGERGEG